MDQGEPVRIVEETATSAAAQHCLQLYYQELDARFETGFDPGMSILASLEEFSPPRGSFLVMRMGCEPIGCGGLTPLTGDAAYLKRMWIAPNARGRGLARRLLAALEDKARSMGYRMVKLETNKVLTEGLRLYRSSGYVEVAPFNDEYYADHWFEKRIS